MNEANKTIGFVFSTLVLFAVWAMARPKQEVFRPDAVVGKPLFEKFSDPTAAARLKIVRWDEEVGRLHRFEVAKNSQTGLWTLPSHGGYPADAENQMRDVAVSLVGLDVLDVVSNVESEHEMLGVIEPGDQTKAGDKGVGLLVQFEDSAGKGLASLIVGKSIKDQDGHRFVRVPSQSAVFVAKLDPAKLSTSFADWIEKDLLKLSPWDVERLRIRDYALVGTTQGLLPEKRFDATTTYNTTDAKWNLDEFVGYRRKEGSLTQFDALPLELAATEELNKTKLDDLKNALDDLKIIDVRRKPQGLGADLTAEEDILKNRELQESLVGLGYYPIRNEAGKVELLCANGEVHVAMKDGYEYVLRFGNVANTDEGEKGALNRYLFVTTRVLYDKFPQPELEPLPAAPAAPAVPAAEPKQPEPPAADANKPAETKPAETKPAESKPAESKPPENSGTGSGGCGDEPAAPATPAAKPADPAAAPSPPAANAPPADASPAADGAKPGDAQPPAAPAKSAEQTAHEAEVERITKANQRKLDEWNEKKKKAEDRVRELNGRFAGWYYVVAEDVYRKIRLSRNDLIKETDKAAEEGFGVDAFRKLQTDGLDKQAEPKVETN